MGLFKYIEQQKRWVYDIIAILILLLGISIFHWRGIQPGYTFLPVDLANTFLPWQQFLPSGLQNSLISDPLHQYFPFTNTTTSLLQIEKQLPLWNPYVFSGHPTLADPLSQPFYPVMPLLSLLVGTARAFALGLWGQVCLAALFTYGWLRMSRFSYAPALAGAFTYALSGYLVTWFETTFWLSSIALFPGVLFLFEATIRTKKVIYLGGAAGLVGLAFLGGQIQFTITFILFGGMYALGRAGSYKQQHAEKWWLPFTYFVFISFTGILLAGVFLLPFIEFTTLSHRFTQNTRLLTDKLPWQQLITLILPNFYGNPTTGGYWGYAGNYSEGTVYVGVIALFLSSLTIFHKKSVTAISIIIITALAFYFILGGPCVSLLGLLPGFSFLTLHRTVFILPLFFAWLTASALSLSVIKKETVLVLTGLCIVIIGIAVSIGTEHWSQIYSTTLITIFLLMLMVALLFLQSSWPQYRLWFNLGFVLLIFVDLYIWGHMYNPTGEVSALMQPTSGIIQLQQQVFPNQHRALVYQRHDQILVGLGNSLANYRLPVAGGNSSLVNNRYLQLAIADDPGIDIGFANKGNVIAYSYPSERLLNLLGITHLVSSERLPYPDVYPESVQNDCSQTILASTDNQPITGSFTPQHSAINRLDVKVKGNVNGVISVQLWQDAEVPRLVLEEQATPSPDGAEQILTFFFAPEKEAVGKQYTWSLQVNPETAVSMICANEQGDAAVSVYGTIWDNNYGDEFYIYERLPMLPKAYVVYAAETISEDNQMVARLLDDDFDIDNQVITAVSVPLAEHTSLFRTPAAITDYKSGRVVITTETEDVGLLVLRDQHHPGWKVTIDGQQSSLLRVNHIFRGVMLPSGTHEIIFTFQPLSLSIGLAVSGLGLFLLLTGLFLLHKKQIFIKI